MLHRHPRLALFNETHWLPRMYEFYGTTTVRWSDLLSVALRTTWSSGRDLFDVNLEYSAFDTREELVDELSSRLARRGYLGVREFHEVAAETCLSPTDAWGEKTPDYGFYMRLVQSLWPECKFLHVVRNGLDTAQSMSRHTGCRLMAAAGYDNWCPLSFDRLYEKYERREMPLETHVGSWRRRLVRIRAEAEGLSPGSYLEIRYENLLVRPREVLEETATWLGLPPDRAWADEAGEIARPPGPRIEPPVRLALGLLPDDLHVLDREGSIDDWKVPIPSNRDDLLRLLRRMRRTPVGSPERMLRAAKTAVTVFCSDSVRSDVEIAEATLALLRPVLRQELGETAVDRWEGWLADARAANG